MSENIILTFVTHTKMMLRNEGIEAKILGTIESGSANVILICSPYLLQNMGLGTTLRISYSQCVWNALAQLLLAIQNVTGHSTNANSFAQRELGLVDDLG